MTGIDVVNPVWDAWHPDEAADRLTGVTVPWYVAAGWALQESKK